MNILVDTHVVLGILWRTLADEYPAIRSRLAEPSNVIFVSVVSLWEIAIKSRLGKLDAGMPLPNIIEFLQLLDVVILPLEARHAIANAEPEPNTRDPFDRMLLAQCQVDGLILATVDRALIDHRLALKV